MTMKAQEYKYVAHSTMPVKLEPVEELRKFFNGVWLNESLEAMPIGYAPKLASIEQEAVPDEVPFGNCECCGKLIYDEEDISLMNAGEVKLLCYDCFTPIEMEGGV